MSKGKGGYTGGSTIISRKSKTWGSPEPRAPSAAELRRKANRKAEAEAFYREFDARKSKGKPG